MKMTQKIVIKTIKKIILTDGLAIYNIIEVLVLVLSKSTTRTIGNLQKMYDDNRPLCLQL